MKLIAPNLQAKTIILLLSSCALLAACKKDKQPTNPAEENEQVSELSSPFVNQAFGKIYQYDALGKMPLTVLLNGDLLMTTINSVDSLDRLQVFRMNASGAVLWQKQFTSGRQYHSGNSFETSDGSVIVLGSRRTAFDWVRTRCFIARLNGNTGDTLWTRQWGENYLDYAFCGLEAPDKNYWILDLSDSKSIATLLKIAPNGDSLTCRTFSLPVNSKFITAMVSSDKKIWVAAETSSSGQKQILLKKITDGSQDFSIQASITGLSDLRIKTITETSDGFCVVGGEATNKSDPTIAGFLVKFNGNGNIVWQKTINIAIASCTEKKPDVFYLGAGCAMTNKLFLFELSTMTEVKPPLAAVGCERQLVRKGKKLYRIIADVGTDDYETARMAGYTINN